MVKLAIIGNIAFQVYGDDHRPAHFHVVAPDYQAMIEIETLAVMQGTIPARDRKAVTAWAVAHQDDVKAAWNRLNPDKAI